MNTPDLIDEKLQRLDQLAATRIQVKLLAYLQATRAPCTTAQLAEGLGINQLEADIAVVALLSANELAAVGLDAHGFARFWAVLVGRCEWCGLVDHHLVMGECPDCATRANPQQQKETPHD